jgi:hypothetical protein
MLKILKLNAVIALLCFTSHALASVNGPLRVSEDNPRYFTDDSGEAVYLTGSHTWNSLVEIVPVGEEAPFDYEAYLKFLKAHNHNFFRLWCWDLLNWDTRANQPDGKVYEVYPKPWLRTGEELALDGKAKFDLNKLNPEYFARLKERVRRAKEEGIYVAVMLFDGWGIQFSANAYENHPFHPDNNVNTINFTTNEEQPGFELYEVYSNPVIKLQMKYVREVVETVNEFDNVLFEISNENHGGSTDWQYAMIDYIRFIEAKLGRHHPIGMTFQWQGGSDHNLMNSSADWISPGRFSSYKFDPPPSDGTKVIIPDTDHLWGIGGSREWAWKSFMRGLNPIFMDPYDNSVLSHGDGPEWQEEVNSAMGNTRLIADSVPLIRMIPSMTIASSEYCLYEAGKEYLIYLPETSEVEIDLEGVTGTFQAKWTNTVTMESIKAKSIKGGSLQTLKTPGGQQGMLLHLKLK